MMISNPRILVTGFGPFTGVDVNPSAELARASGRPFHILEVSFVAADAFIERLDPESFDHWLMIGVARGAKTFRLECRARNIIGPTTDVRGVTAAGPIDPVGPPDIAISFWNHAAPVPGNFWAFSDNAGDYLCNYLMYQAARKFGPARVGFLHVPGFETIAEPAQRAFLADLLHHLESRR